MWRTPLPCWRPQPWRVPPFAFVLPNDQARFWKGPASPDLSRPPSALTCLLSSVNPQEFEAAAAPICSVFPSRAIHSFQLFLSQAGADLFDKDGMICLLCPDKEGLTGFNEWLAHKQTCRHCFPPAPCGSFSPQGYFAGSGCSRIQHHTHTVSLHVVAPRGQLGTSHHRVSPLAPGAGARSRSWEGFTSTATGARRTVPRITNPSGTAAASCSRLSRWVTRLPAWGMGS